MTECYRCGQEGHSAARCDTPPAPAAARADPLGLLRRPASEIADAHAWAAKIRQRMGWVKAGD